VYDFILDVNSVYELSLFETPEFIRNRDDNTQAHTLMRRLLSLSTTINLFFTAVSNTFRRLK